MFAFLRCCILSSRFFLSKIIDLYRHPCSDPNHTILNSGHFNAVVAVFSIQINFVLKIKFPLVFGTEIRLRLRLKSV